MNESGDEFLSVQADFVAKIVEKVGVQLSELNVLYTPSKLVPVTVNWVVEAAAEEELSLDEYVASVDDGDGVAGGVDEIVKSVTGVFLLMIGEERPGSEPWEHEYTIPVPVSVALIVSHVSSMCATVAYGNNADSWSQTGYGAAASVTSILAEQFIRNEYVEGKMSIMFKDGLKTLEGPIVKLPQPGVAFIARFFEGCADFVRKGLWKVDDLEVVSKDDVAAVIEHEAVILRDLCLRFGVSPGPKKNS